MLAHGARVVAHRRRHDVDPGLRPIELRRLEVGRERDHVVEVDGRLDHIDRLVLRDRHEIAIDQVLAGSQHRIAVGLERAPERVGMVGLHEIDDRRLVGARIDLTRGRRSRGLLLGERLQAELQDRVRIEAVECAVGDELVVQLAPDGPVVRAAGERIEQPAAVFGHGDLGPLDRPLQPASFAVPEDAVAGDDDLVEERGHLRCGLDLDLLPRPDLRDARPGARLVEVRRARPRGDRRSRSAARATGRGLARTAGTARRRAGPAPSSGAPRSGSPRPRTSTGGRCGSRARARSGRSRTARPDPATRSSPGAPCPPRPRSAAHPRPASPSSSSCSWMPIEVARIGLSRSRRSKRASTRSYSASSSGPAGPSLPGRVSSG